MIIKDGKRYYGGGIARREMQEDVTRCIEEVCSYDTRWPRYYQCQRKRTHGEHCHQHHPDTIAAKKEEQKKKYEKESAYRHRQYLGPRAIELIEKIARGHNDPRSACIAFLDESNVKWRKA